MHTAAALHVVLGSMLLAAIPAQEPASKPAEWLQDFAAAKQKAKENKLDLLLDFTGSDWCGWCIKLDEEVFAQPEFQAEAPKHFVLVKLDFPNKKDLVTDEVRAQNEKLQREFAVKGFPTIVLTDADGRPYAQTGYAEGGPTAYLESLAAMQKVRAARDDGFARFAATTGAVERAQALAAALSGIDEDLVAAHYQAEIKQIIALDADGKGGVKAKFEEMLANAEAKGIVAELERKLNELGTEQKWAEADKLFDEHIAAHKEKKRVLQMATFFKAICAIEGRQDFDGALALFDAAKAVAPESEIGRQIDRVKANVARMRDAQKKDGGGEKKDPPKDGAGNGGGR
jgi:thioredoxin-related protein